MKVLLVDDLTLAIEICRDSLKDRGCKFITASNGREALQSIKMEKPNLVLTDLHMPEMNGEELCKAIKGDPSLAHIPVIIVSTAINMESCITAGCDDILKKPYSPGELIEIVKKHIDIISRKEQRAAVNIEVSYRHGGRIYQGRVIDISLKGMFIRKERSLSVGIETEFSIAADDGSEQLTVEGEVVRVISESPKLGFGEVPGMAVHFKKVTPDLTAFINSLVNH